MNIADIWCWTADLTQTHISLDPINHKYNSKCKNIQTLPQVNDEELFWRILRNIKDKAHKA